MPSSIMVQPELGLINCPVIRPARITPVSDEDVERGEGAIGVGHADLPDGDTQLFLSLHRPGGEVLMASMTPDHAASIIQQLMAQLTRIARFVPGQPAELPN
ncbi:hypothetical protein [Sphingobium cupriresistens]|uniref:hypothetical protein n=1 Tax=Sphingobium cupriresistens TaxID=1132417 RepID=UPI003BADDCFE